VPGPARPTRSNLSSFSNKHKHKLGTATADTQQCYLWRTHGVCPRSSDAAIPILHQMRISGVHRTPSCTMPPFRRVLEQPYHNHGLEVTRSNGHGWYPLTVVGTMPLSVGSGARWRLHNAQLASSSTPCWTSPKPTLTPDQVTAGTVLAACERATVAASIRYADQMQGAGYLLDGLAATSHSRRVSNWDWRVRRWNICKMKRKCRSTRTNAKRRAGKWDGGGRCADHSVAYTLAISACAEGGAWQQGNYSGNTSRVSNCDSWWCWRC
jgi:hypothetical protein